MSKRGPDRPPMTARRRLVFAAVPGIVAGAIVAFFAPWQLADLVVWLVMAALFLVAIWTDIPRFDSAETKAHARIEDSSKQMAHFVLVTAAVVSLVGVAFALVKADQVHGMQKAVLTTAAVLTVVLSWATVHTMFTLRYAHRYYSDENDGGIDFKNKIAPDYLDFAYVAFTIGMTFQVSDTDVQSPRIRRTVLGHALLSYLFGTVIVAVTINVLAGLLNR